MKYLWRVQLLFLVCCFLLAACGESVTTGDTTTPVPKPAHLEIFAAASLTESFNEIRTDYQRAHANVTISYDFEGSQSLVLKLTQGAAADIFASADQTNMKKAQDAGLVTQSQVFARNKLVVIVPASNPANITSLLDLAKQGNKIVLGAPAVPVGKYSLQILDKLGKDSRYGASYEKSVKANIVSQEDQVKAVVTKVQTGEADAGIVYRTDVTAAVAKKVKIIDISDEFNVIAEYPIAVLKNASNATDAQAFVRYLLSTDGQAILKKYGFIGVGDSGGAG